MPRVAADLTLNEGVEPLRQFLLQAAMQGLFSSRPIAWTAATIGDVCELATGATPDSKRPDYYGGPIKWLRSGDINQRVIFDCEGRITEAGLRNSNCKILPADSVLIALNGQGKTRGSVAILRTEAACNQSLVAIIARERDRLKPEFIYWSLRSRYRGIRGLTGKEGDRRGLNMKLVSSLPIAFPTAPEQHHILATVDDLMSLCDELEVAQSRRDETRDRLRVASLTRLSASAETPGRVAQKDVAFVIDHSDRMVTQPQHVADVRRAILRCAVQGLFTSPSPKDAVADDLLGAVDAERGEVAAHDRRATSGQQELLAAEMRWSVPAHWSWRGLADLALFIDYRGKTPEKVSNGVPLITAKNVRPGRINSEPREFITEDEYSKWMTRGLPRQGDILFTTEAPMGNAAVVDTDERFALAQRIIDLRVYGSIAPAFVSLILNAEPFQRILDATATGLTAKGIKSAKLRRLPVPIPPVDEQLSVVAEVNGLMMVCDELEQALQEAEKDRANALRAVLHEALNGRSRAAA